MSVCYSKAGADLLAAAGVVWEGGFLSVFAAAFSQFYCLSSHYITPCVYVVGVVGITRLRFVSCY